MPEYQLRGRWKEWFTKLIRLQPHLILFDGEYLKRLWLLPKNRWCNVYLHYFNGPDRGPWMHDHPYDNLSLILRRGYVEKRIAPPFDWEAMVDADCVAGASLQLIAHGPGSVILRSAAMPHHIESVQPGTLTLFITGPAVRVWGFHTASGWRPWKTVLGVGE